MADEPEYTPITDRPEPPKPEKEPAPVKHPKYGAIVRELVEDVEELKPKRSPRQTAKESPVEEPPAAPAETEESA